MSTGKVEVKMGVDTKSLSKALAAMEQKYGKQFIRKGNDFIDPPRVPTGIVQLDAIIGGGFPIGRFIELYGGYGSAKSMMCWLVAKSAQEMGLSVAYYDVENQYDEKWVSSLGVNTEDILVVNTTIIDEVGETLEALLEPIDIHIIDSVAMGVSRDELAAEVDEWRMAISTRVWDKVLRRANSRFDKERNMVIVVNQAREVFGKQGAEKSWGGKQIDHICSIILHFSKSSWLYRDKNGNLSKDGDQKNKMTELTQPSGIEITVKVDKARKMKARDLATARMRLEFGDTNTFDEAWALTRAAIFYGIVEKSGSWYKLPNGETVQGEGKLKAYILENPEFAEKLRLMYFKGEDLDE